jgi:hypothetical protein
MANKIRRDIHDAKAALKEVMQSNLRLITESMIDQIMRNYRNATPAQRINATKNLTPTGVAEYKRQFLEAMAVVCQDGLESARKDVPSKAKKKLADWDEDALMLGEYEKLPPKVKKRLKAQSDLMVNTQKADLDKYIMMQFSSSLPSTDSESTIKYDLFETAEDYITGPSVDAGAGMMAGKGINEARQAFFFDDEVLEEIEAFEFVNDVPETPICEDLNGTVFSKDDPGFDRYNPPLHFNCDSYILPILNGKLGDREITQLKPSNSDLEKYIQFHKKECNCKVFYQQY